MGWTCQHDCKGVHKSCVPDMKESILKGSEHIFSWEPIMSLIKIEEIDSAALVRNKGIFSQDILITSKFYSLFLILSSFDEVLLKY